MGMHQRQGLASALLGVQPVLLSDEPVNGLDREGIQPLRSLFRRFAVERSTGFISSHNRGQLVADMRLDTFRQRSGKSPVKVVSPRAHELVPHLGVQGSKAADGTPNKLSVTGLDTLAIGAITFEHEVPLHEYPRSERAWRKWRLLSSRMTASSTVTIRARP